MITLQPGIKTPSAGKQKTPAVPCSSIGSLGFKSRSSPAPNRFGGEQKSSLRDGTDYVNSDDSEAEDDNRVPQSTMNDTTENPRFAYPCLKRNLQKHMNQRAVFEPGMAVGPSPREVKPCRASIYVLVADHTDRR